MWTLPPSFVCFLKPPQFSFVQNSQYSASQPLLEKLHPSPKEKEIQFLSVLWQKTSATLSYTFPIHCSRTYYLPLHTDGSLHQAPATFHLRHTVPEACLAYWEQAGNGAAVGS